MLDNLAWLVLFLPLLSVAGITALTMVNRAQPRVCAQISIAAAVISFLLGLILFYFLPEADLGRQFGVSWLSIGGLKVDIGLRLDHLSLPMVLIVTGVGS